MAFNVKPSGKFRSLRVGKAGLPPLFREIEKCGGALHYLGLLPHLHHGAANTVKLSQRFTRPIPAESLYKPAPVAAAISGLLVE